MAEYEEASSCVDKLSSREKEILNALAIGMSNKAAARLLDLSPRTVEVHRSNMIRKSGQKSLSDLLQVYYVIKRLQPLTEIRGPLNRSAADHNHAPTNSASVYHRQSPKTLPKDADEMAGRGY